MRANTLVALSLVVVAFLSGCASQDTYGPPPPAFAPGEETVPDNGASSSPGSSSAFPAEAYQLLDLTGQALADYYASLTNAAVPKIKITANGEEIAYTAVRSDAIAPSVLEEGSWFTEMARANLKERPALAREDAITVTFLDSPPEAVEVVDHWLSPYGYPGIPPVGTSNLGSKYIPEEMPDMVEKNTVVYPLDGSSFSFSAGYYKYPNEHYLSDLGATRFRGIQLKCEAGGLKVEYFFLLNIR